MSLIFCWLYCYIVRESSGPVGVPQTILVVHIVVLLKHLGYVRLHNSCDKSYTYSHHKVHLCLCDCTPGHQVKLLVEENGSQKSGIQKEQGVNNLLALV